MAANEREEYSAHYRRAAALLSPAEEPPAVTECCRAPGGERSDILLLGSAGQYINTAGEVLCLAGMSGGLQVTQKNDYPITVLRGHSIAEVVFSVAPIEYTGMGTPAAVLCLAAEGVDRRRRTIAGLPASSLVIKAKDVVIGETAAKVIELDFTALGVKGADRATAALAVLAEQGALLTREMLAAGMCSRYRGKMLEASEAVVARMFAR
jgi:Pyruvate/2-oxoacid:ferredoxin oxidoreductase gamma subunit